MRLFFSAALWFWCASAGAEPVDWLITAKYVVTMDAKHRVIEQGAVAISGARIVAVGTQADLAAHFQPKHSLDKELPRPAIAGSAHPELTRRNPKLLSRPRLAGSQLV